MAIFLHSFELAYIIYVVATLIWLGKGTPDLTSTLTSDYTDVILHRQDSGSNAGSIWRESLRVDVQYVYLCIGGTIECLIYLRFFISDMAKTWGYQMGRLDGECSWKNVYIMSLNLVYPFTLVTVASTMFNLGVDKLGDSTVYSTLAGTAATDGLESGTLRLKMFGLMIGWALLWTLCWVKMVMARLKHPFGDDYVLAAASLVVPLVLGFFYPLLTNGFVHLLLCVLWGIVYWQLFMRYVVGNKDDGANEKYNELFQTNSPASFGVPVGGELATNRLTGVRVYQTSGLRRAKFKVLTQ